MQNSNSSDIQAKQLNILLADDDTDDCVFFKRALKELAIPISLTTVHDGEQLMDFLANKTNELPHVLFLDLNMPRKNGFECLSEIKSNEKLSQLPSCPHKPRKSAIFFVLHAVCM